MSRKYYTKETDPLVLIDTNEATVRHTCKLAQELLTNKHFKVEIKGPEQCIKYLGTEKYEPWGDYILVYPEDSPVHPGGAIVGIERKTTLDAYGRIVDGSMNAQLAELVGKTDGKAILMHEKSTYVPVNIVRSMQKQPFKGKITKAMQAAALNRIVTAVDTKFNKLDFAVVRWEIDSVAQAIRHIADLCEHGWNYQISGRGYTISRGGKRIKITEDKE